ncbi:MarR family transcriptional regulator [Deinococcus cavernae]|uniref:MarR family transcriptional regulator n=1 Tax=Deinococcus cavernae TaxID=2320857 RepID=A0A418VA77_9DEIO|nr:MarR family transcriptional regulator [Deinococcus cavernae]
MRELHRHGFTDLRHHHFLHVSRWLSPAGRRPSELAEDAGISRQAMSDLLTELEGLGYVKRIPDPSDARARLIIPAERGYAADAILQAFWRSRELQLREQYGDARVNDVSEIILAYREAVK